MKMSPMGIAMLAGSEGIVPAPYMDSVGVWTWGIGHTKAAGPPNPLALPMQMPENDQQMSNTIRQVIEVFMLDVVKYENEVMAALTRVPSQYQFDALVHFHFNTGGIARANLTRHFNDGDFALAAEAFMGWVKPSALRKRRESEQALFRSGIYSLHYVSIYGTDGRGKLGLVIKRIPSHEIEEYAVDFRNKRGKATTPWTPPPQPPESKAYPAAVPSTLSKDADMPESTGFLAALLRVFAALFRSK